MTWLRLEDNMLDHPKWRRALREGGDAVLAVWYRLTSWCSRHLTDGVIPADMLDEIAEARGDRVRRRALQALIDCSLVARAGSDACSIVDYLERNPSRGEVLAARAAAAERKRKHRHGSPVTLGQPAESHDLATPRRNYPSHPIPSHPSDPLLLPRVTGEPEPGPPEPEPEAIIEPIDDGWPESEPAETQGQRAVWRSLEGFVPSDELYAEAAMQGVSREVFDRQLKKLKNGPIGGARGVFDREDYVREQIPKWRTWDETDRAKARAAPTGGFRGAMAASVIEPTAKHRAYAKRYGLDVDALARELETQGAVEALGAKGALDALGSKLTAAARAAKGAAA